MRKYNEENERMKRRYLQYLKDVNRMSSKSIDKHAAALNHYDELTGYKPFKKFRIEQAVAYKAKLEKALNLKTKKPYSAATLSSTLRSVKSFFVWLAGQPGYKSRISYSDADYFNASNRIESIAHARRETRYPSMEQALHTFRQMPDSTDLEKRDRAVFALIVLTGARDGAVASFRLKHIDIVEGYIYQDARDVNTKFSKTFHTAFFPVEDEYRVCLTAWVKYLRTEKLFGPDDPLFPKTKVGVGASRKFEALGLDREPWANATAIRVIIRRAFVQAGIEPFPPHSFRHMLVKLGERVTTTREEWKAWSQNFGHAHVKTTESAYAPMGWERQADLIKGMWE